MRYWPSSVFRYLSHGVSDLATSLKSSGWSEASRDGSVSACDAGSRHGETRCLVSGTGSGCGFANAAGAEDELS